MQKMLHTRATYSFRLVLLLWLSLLAGCERPGGSSQLVVFAASSLADAFEEIARAFETKHADVDIALNFGGSSQLVAQLREGAVADVFAPADELQMQAAIDANRVDRGSARPFATNQLVVVVPVDNPAGVTALEDLGNRDLSLVLAAPGVPVRTYTDQIVSTLDPAMRARIYANVVSEEDNVRQALAKVALGEADASVVYVTDALSDINDRVQQIAIAAERNVTAVYSIAVVREAPNRQLAEQFVQFVLGEEGQAILTSYGFSTP